MYTPYYRTKDPQITNLNNKQIVQAWLIPMERDFDDLCRKGQAVPLESSVHTCSASGELGSSLHCYEQEQ